MGFSAKRCPSVIARYIDEPLFLHAVITRAVFSLLTGQLVIIQ